MRKILAIIGAIIAGGLGIAVVGTAQQASTSTGRLPSENNS
jgi:hypothetical protein